MAAEDDLRRPVDPAIRLPFIVSSDMGRVDSATRKLIRSHVMRGKKQKRSRPRKDQRTTSKGPAANRNQVARVQLKQVEEVLKKYRSLVPSRVGSDLSFVELADEIELSMLLNMTKVSMVAMRVIFPLKVAIGFQQDRRAWFYPIAQDAVALHISAFAMEGFIDRILRRQEQVTNPTAIVHFQKGLGLLRERLLGDDEELKISDATISVVLKLASAAHLDGDNQTSEQHMEGLRKMVDLRGGLEVFKGQELLVEMLRCDLSIALRTGSNHVFFCQPSEPMMEYPEKLLPMSDKMSSQDSIELNRNMNSDLVIAWRVMKRFCMMVNLGTQTQSLIRPEIIHETMAAVMYRLLHMDFPAGSLDKIVRQGLLVFSHHIFLQWEDIRLPSNHFPTIYRNCVQGLQLVDGVSSQFILWLLTIGAISLFDISREAWLRECLQDYTARCRVKSWKAMQELLKSFMWLPLLDEQAGKNVYDLIHLDNGKTGN